jgi:hypothetical protein
MIQAITGILTNFAASCNPNSTFLGIFPAWYKYLNPQTDALGGCVIKFNELNDLLPIGLALIEAATRLAGVISVIFIMLAGYRYVTSGGNSDKAKSARETAINALIGLVIATVASAAVSFIAVKLTEGGTS